MSGADEALEEAVARLLSQGCGDDVLATADRGTWPEALWTAMEAFGLTLALVSEESGGLGLATPAAFALLARAGEAALPLPLAETMVANRLLDLAGLTSTGGPIALALLDDAIVTPPPGALRLVGTAPRVPWGRQGAVVAIASRDDAVWAFRIPRDAISVRPGTNLANEPRDTLVIDAEIRVGDAARVPGLPSVRDVAACLAAARCSQMAGAMGAAAEMTVGYALQRKQFGRALAQFQAVQQSIAVMAEQAAAGRAAAELAAEAVESFPVRRAGVAAGKLRAGEAAGLVAGIAHQVHGAIGFTHEYRLNHLTRRLWAWRDEYGNEAVWADELGRTLAEADGLWAAITAV